jgi:hypothetical protein
MSLVSTICRVMYTNGVGIIMDCIVPNLRGTPQEILMEIRV